MRLSLTLAALLAVLAAEAQQNFWSATASRAALQEALQQRQYKVDRYEAFQLDLPAMQQALRQAPLERTSSSQPIELMMPMPDGTFEAFQIVEAPVMAPGLASRYPAIKTYRGWNPDQAGASIRLGYGPSKGFYATILSSQGAVYIDAAGPSYISYYTHENPNPQLRQGFQCAAEAEGPTESIYEGEVLESRSPVNTATLRTYRLAMACTGEYAQYHGGTVESALEAIVIKVNRLNQVFERDLAMRVELIANNDELIFLDGDTDGLSNGVTDELLNQIGPIINSTIGLPNYDVGHVLNVHGDAPGNGVALLQGLCSVNKANGVSGITVPEGDPFVIDIIAHEFGHQFGATHTMNSCQNVNAATAFEPGSGSTIMAYAGICGTMNNLTSTTDDHYHSGSLEQIFDFTRQGNGDGCAAKTPTDNTAPAVDIPLRSGFFIPVGTPFELTATAADPDADALTYCWEQYDLGPINTGLGNPQGNSPLFRSFSPVTSPTRVFPRLNKIISNNFDDSEILPNYGRNLTFRCTVRDNNPAGGNAVWDEVAFQSDANAGPFLVQIPNADTVMWEVGSYEEIAWDVANTDNDSVRCNFVNIKLSVDGGFTYPYTLLGNTPNDGSAFVTVPDAISDDARVRVEAADNIFFDISNEDFEIAPATEPGFAMTIDQEFYAPVCLFEATEIQIGTAALLGFEQPISLSLEGNLPADAEAVFSENPVTPGDTATLTINWGTLVEDTFDLEIIGLTDSLPPASRFLTLATVANDFSGLELLTPATGKADVVVSTTFSWAAAPGADTYEFELATSPVFGDSTVYQEAGITDPSGLTPQDFVLESDQFYYWRVRPVNEQCGPGEWLDPFVFRTASIACDPFAPADLPINISTNPNTKISSINVLEEGTISDINLSDVEVVYQPVNNIRISLISPAGTEVLLFDQNCLSTGLIRLGFDDEAPNDILCPPLSGQVAKPVEALSTFDGEGTAGEWQFVVEAVSNGSGGAIESWNIEFCATTVLSRPSLLTNEPLSVPPGGGNTVTTDELSAEDDNYNPAQLKYRIITLPEHGQLFRGGVELAVDGHFTQETIESLNLVYVHDGSDTQADEFIFTIENPEGGFVGTEAFSIIIDEDATVSTQAVAADNRLTLFPNPARDRVTLQLQQPLPAIATVQLFNMHGQLLQETRFPQGARQMELTTANLPDGLYVVRVQSGKEQLSKKLILRR